jgi:hypothetical protein
MFLPSLPCSRRWINGTVASFMYFFTSKKASLLISGGFFDSHKAGKSIRLVKALWSLNLMQFGFVLISPSVFGVALYNGLINGAKFWSAFSWARYVVYDCEGLFGEIDVSVLVTVFYLLIYVWWSFNAYFHKVISRLPSLAFPDSCLSLSRQGGKVPEWQCGLVVLSGFLTIFPVYAALIASAVAQVSTVHWIVMASVLGPVAIAFLQSATSAMLYVLYLPWFLSLAVFFLVHVPSYSFARLWDTTWGNRETSRDENVDTSGEQLMKRYVGYFVIVLVCLNLALTLGFCVGLTVTAQLIFMVILFLPTIIQIIGSIYFLGIVVPYRNVNNRETRTGVIFE